MMHLLEPFTPQRLSQETSLQATENGAIDFRQVNSQVNDTIHRQMQDMNWLLKEIITLLKEEVASSAGE